MSTQLVRTNRFRDLFDAMFDASADWFVGVDKTLDELAEKWDSAFEHFHEFPASTVTRVDDQHYTIDLEVEGFAKDDLTITLRGDELLIDGEKKSVSEDDGVEKTRMQTLHQRFLLSDVLEVKDATIKNDVLHITLECMKPVTVEEKHVEIH